MVNEVLFKETFSLLPPVLLFPLPSFVLLFPLPLELPVTLTSYTAFFPFLNLTVIFAVPAFFAVTLNFLEEFFSQSNFRLIGFHGFNCIFCSYRLTRSFSQ